MKPITKQRIKSRFTVGLVAVMGALGLSGTPGCSEFHPIWGPSRLSSNYKQRVLHRLGRKLDKFMRSEKPHEFDREDDTLYIRADNFHSTMNDFCLANTGTYNNTFETNRMVIEYVDPVTGEKVVRKQIIPNDGTLDTAFGRVDGFGTLAEVDARITAKARKYFNKPEMEVLVTQDAGDFVNPPLFLGFANATDSDNSTQIDKASVVGDLQGAIYASGLDERTKYFAVSKRTGNMDKRDEQGNFFDSNKDGKLICSTSHPDYIRRVVLIGETAKAAFHGYEKINVGDEDVMVGVGNSDYGLSYRINDFGRFGDFFNSVSGASDSVQYAQGSLDTGFRGNHLAKNQGRKESALQRAGRVLGDVSAVTGNVGLIKGDVEGLVPGSDSGNGSE